MTSLSKFLPPDSSLHHPPVLKSMRLHGRNVAVGEAVQIKGDAELRDQVEHDLEKMIKERLLEAKLKAESLLAHAQQEAEEIVQAAHQEAQSLIQQAQGEQEGIRAAAQEEGFKTGFEEGYADATEQMENETIELLQGAQTILQGAYQAERLVLKSFEKQALHLVQHVAKRVIQGELEASPEKLLTIIENAVESLHLSGKVRVVVSAEMLQLIRRYTSKTSQAVDEMTRYELIGDAQLALDQIYVLSQEGSFDLTPATQIHALIKPLEGHLKSQLNQAYEEAANDDVVSALSQVLEVESSSIQVESDYESLDEQDDSSDQNSNRHSELTSVEPVREYVSFDELIFEESDLDILNSDSDTEHNPEQPG